jgi:hypothetical protein
MKTYYTSTTFEVFTGTENGYHGLTGYYTTQSEVLKEHYDADVYYRYQKQGNTGPL